MAANRTSDAKDVPDPAKLPASERSTAGSNLCSRLGAPPSAAPLLDRANFTGLVLGGGGRPDYLQKLKVPEGYEKMIDVSNI